VGHRSPVGAKNNLQTKKEGGVKTFQKEDKEKKTE